MRRPPSPPTKPSARGPRSEVGRTTGGLCWIARIAIGACAISIAVCSAGFANAASGQVPVGDVVLHFVPAEEIARRWPGTAADTFPSRVPCEIYLPAGMRLQGDENHWPYSGMFVDQYDAGLVAHELLHCAVGAWHPQR